MKTFLILLCSVLLISCEKNINFTLHEAPNLVVVDGTIENGQPPIVVLTNSFDYFSKITPELLSNIFIHDAQVTISNGSITQQLKEYSIDSSGGTRIYYYSIDTINLQNAFTGQLDTKYDLKVVTNDKEYTAVTSIPALSKKIDSLWWKPAPFSTDSTKVIVFVRATDPPGLGNYIRYYTKTNHGPFLPGIQSVFDDQLIDGTTYDLRLDPGIDRNDPIGFEDNFFHHGDTLTMKLSQY